jgi:hypothetical protein
VSINLGGLSAMQTGLQDMGSELPSNRGKDASVAASVIDGAAAAEEGVSGSTDGRLESSADTSAPAPLSSAEKDGVALDRDVEAAVRALVDEVEVAAAENLTEGPGVKEGTGATDAGASQAACTAAGKDIESRSKVYGGAAMIAPGNRVEWAAAGLRAVQPLPQNHDFHDSGDRKRQVSPRKTIAPVGASPEVACGETGARWFATVDLALVVPSPLSLSPYAFPYGTNARAAAAADTSPPPPPPALPPTGVHLAPVPYWSASCGVQVAGDAGRATDFEADTRSAYERVVGAGAALREMLARARERRGEFLAPPLEAPAAVIDVDEDVQDDAVSPSAALPDCLHPTERLFFDNSTKNNSILCSLRD